ncbi:peptidase S8/S53 domain-containing protein [Neohortaea acidophila]|uniref:Peptidase S8/S53 domain-containing protein n=1 Tax=Neohortaea acidophila TaxID=245834 RepID=A0A6A6PK78_9PEZI|nr:peptidase S8/S53 domain-containing protein [Neohortaea acidophila]KAF2480460.1 peptidase S8/S53 domain-containing protein [Neohortaea acidophila]
MTMDEVMKILIFLCLLFWPRIFAAPLSGHHTSTEHIVIIDKDHPTRPRITDVLRKVGLHEAHPNIKHIYYNSAFHGFAATIPTTHVDILGHMPEITLVEQTTSINTASILIPESGAFDTRNSAPWGLQRISTPSSVAGDPSNLNFTYAFGNANLGANADIYIIDTGIYTANNVFGGRAEMLWSFDGNLNDTDGHGTHVSGIAGGAVLGVASNANIFGLKALDGSGGGTTSDVIKAIDLVVRRHETRRATNCTTGSVISMSLASTGVVQSLNHAIYAAATKAKIHSVVAAGNNAGSPNACSISPASAGGTNGPALSVGAIDITSSPASFTNYGACVDLFAPGVDVISSWIGAPDRVASLDGTSMSTPHVTGLVAYAMANETLAGDPWAMKEYIRGTAVEVRGGVLVANNGVLSDG